MKYRRYRVEKGAGKGEEEKEEEKGTSSIVEPNPHKSQ
jgi:hypothetical protein